MNRGYIGIDPGVSGGVSVQYPAGSVKTFSCPETVHEMAVLLKEIPNYNWDYVVVLEFVHAMPGQGVTSMFTFGKNYGRWQGILAALRIPYKLVQPRQWQKHFGGMPTKKKNEKASKHQQRRKNHLKELAQSRHPELKITLKTADAVLLMDYAREVAWIQ